MALSVARGAPRLRGWSGVRDRLRGRFSLRTVLIAATALLAIAVMLSATATFLEYRAVDDLQGTVATKLQPAQRATQQLGAAFVRREAIERSYLLTGNKSLLTAWNDGKSTIDHLEHSLPDLLSVDATAAAAYKNVRDDGRTWEDGANNRVQNS